MRLFAAVLFAVILPLRASGAQTGDFAYYVMALSWSPTFCALTGAKEGTEQCKDGTLRGFVLHGLWPQNQEGWPEFCRTAASDPSRSDTASMSDIMGSSGLAWHQWKKHGRCTGLTSDEYFAASRKAFQAVRIPDVFRGLNKDVELPVSVVEEAFIEANPGMIANGITVTCDEERIDEVRICLSKDLTLRECGQDVRRDCRMLDALMEAP
jgi:ribonuclease T2